MKAVQILNYKDPRDFVPKEIPDPALQPGEVLLRVLYAGINPSDLANTQGFFADHTVLPRVVGRDFVGKIVQGPPALMGRTVMGSGGDIGFVRDGSFAEYLAVPEAGVVLVPDGLELTHAASLGVPFLAALACLNCLPRSLDGRILLVIGGTGAVGSAATTIARRRGAQVVRTLLKQEELDDLAPSLRDGVFMDLSDGHSLEAETARLTEGRGFDFVLNLVGGKTLEPSLNCLKDYGSMACIASPGQARVEFSLLEFYRRNLSLFGLNTGLNGVVPSATLLRQLMGEFEGSIESLATLGKTQVLPFSEAGEVLKKALAKEFRKPIFKM